MAAPGVPAGAAAGGAAPDAARPLESRLSRPANLLGGRDPAAFLSRYWQKRPLLVRGALQGFRDPFTADELAGLACEADVESRLVLVRGGQRPYELVEGPQDPERLRRLPRSHWTLLVQRADHKVPVLADLLDIFDFVPRWRLDDVMVSFATAGGGVGPHVDNYDVFLVQGLGRRRWEVQRRPDRTPRRGLDLEVLERFTPDEGWVLERGDMLYVPPGVAHYGVGLADGFTYSIGFRAPSHRALVGAFAERLLQGIAETDFYRDPDLSPPSRPGEVSAATLSRLRGIVRDEVRRGLGRDLRPALAGALTAQGWATPRQPPLPAGELRRRLEAGQPLVRAPTARAAFVRSRNSCSLFFNGQERRLPLALLPLAAALSGERRVPASALKVATRRADALRLLGELVDEGVFAFVRSGRRDG